MNKKWECPEIDETKVNNLIYKYKMDKILAKILANRGISDDREMELFLKPTRADFHDPFLMPDMEIAVNRILKAIHQDEKIIIYGDYDADGITSVTVLKKFLEERGIVVGTYIPNRISEGYGLNIGAVKNIYEQGYNLIITVDCGITGTEEIDYANSLGMEVIVTDHHEPADKLPKALAIVDTKRKDNKYPFTQLAGVGVVFKLIQAFSIKVGIEQKEYLKYLDIVCIGTISDIVPLVDENRVIAKLGLLLVAQTRNPGLKALLKITGFNNINSTTISFGIAPRINACGRMGNEKLALELFLSNNYEAAEKLAIKLNEYNKKRQAIEKQIYDEAVEIIEQENQDNSCIVLGNDDWSHGIIGIVASKITEKYYKPSILVCYEGNMGKGSGRSIQGFDLHEALMECGDSLEKFGGHEMAVGITIKRENFSKFRDSLERYAKKKQIDKLVPVIKIDCELMLKEINIDSIKSLQLLEPFGEANQEPLFFIKNLKINSIRALSEGKHLKVGLREDKYIIDAIGFNMGEFSEKFMIDDKVDIIGSLSINSFNGVENMQIILKDIRKSY